MVGAETSNPNTTERIINPSMKYIFYRVFKDGTEQVRLSRKSLEVCTGGGMCLMHIDIRNAELPLHHNFQHKKRLKR